MRTAILDHVAIATRELTHGWGLFGGLLGGSWVYGGDDPGFWWGQLRFATGPKIELLTPTGGPDAAFLERFLASRGAGPHHLNFAVTDIGEILARVHALGIEPVNVRLASPTWKEAFLHPRDAQGIVIQVAQPGGPAPRYARPAELPAPGTPCDFALAEHRVQDIDAAIRLYTRALDGEITSRGGRADTAVADLTWHNGARLRLVQAADAGQAGLGSLHFIRHAAAFSAAELDLAAGLSDRLGVSLDLLTSGTAKSAGPADSGAG